MRFNSTAKNVISLGILQAFNYILPLFSVPYLLMKLGAEINGYLITSQTIVSYFALLIDYGFVLTASKRVALTKKREEIQKIFSSVFICKGILTGFSFILLAVVCVFIGNKALIYCILIGSFQIVGYLFNPIWLFQGTENADLLAKVNIVIRTIFYMLIFVIVQSPNDLYKAVLLLSVPHFIIGIICYIRAKKFFQIKIVRVSRSYVLTELKEGFYGFWVTVMNFSYTSSGILLLGFYSNQEVVGVYGTIEKLIRAGIQVFNPIIHGLYPKVLNLLSESKTKQFKIILCSGIIFSLIIGTGLLLFSPLISKLLLVKLSSEFSIDVLRILSIWFTLNTINVLIGVWVFFSHNKMQIYSKIYTLATLICILLHLIFIPLIGPIVVPINLVIGEIIITLCFYLFLKRVLV
jgi:polysaccharide transporter, PST family